MEEAPCRALPRFSQRSSIRTYTSSFSGYVMKLARPYGGSAAPARSERNGSSKSPTSKSTLLHQPLDVREGFGCRHDPVGHLAHGVVHPERDRTASRRRCRLAP